MSSKLLSIIVIAIFALSLSAQAFACPQHDRDVGATDRGTSSMYDNGSDQTMNTPDQDMNNYPADRDTSLPSSD